MIFSDPLFLMIFLPLVVLGHRVAIRWTDAAGQWWLVASSLLFYSVWDVRWLPLLAGTIVANWVIGRLLIERHSKGLMIIGLALNLTPLILCKYAGWITGGRLWADVALPLGISFFTFQQMAFLVDCYKGLVKPVGARHYALFVSFFPQLIAGPIVHGRQMIPQFRERFRHDDAMVEQGVFLIVAGLFKKVVIADNLAPYASRVFDGGGIVSIYEAWVGALAYTLQLYMDFSGYCEMAMGFGLLFGYKLPVNFLSPYKSRSVSEFWRTWHITLGAWFKEYCYWPLGGNRNGTTRMFGALFITAFVSGIWHGAGWTFLIWGVMHGIALVVERGGRMLSLKVPDGVALLMTFAFVSLAWVLFRAPDLETAANVYTSMLGINGMTLPPLFAAIAGTTGPVLQGMSGFEIFVLLGLVWWVMTKPNVHEISIGSLGRRTWVSAAASVCVLYFIATPSPFLYFRF